MDETVTGGAAELAFGLDAAMACVIFFVIFFAWLVVYLRREDKREGYPKVGASKALAGGLTPMPRTKVFKRPHGRPPVSTPRQEPRRQGSGRWVTEGTGQPIEPLRDGLVEGLGPAAWQDREDHPDLNVEGKPKIVPLSKHGDYSIAPGDPDPRGWEVLGSDGEVAGTVRDVWFNRAEFFPRYLEVDLAAGGPSTFVPLYFTRLDRRRKRVRVPVMPGRRIADAPRSRGRDEITMRDEDRYNAFFAGGRFYGASPLGEAR